MMKLLGREPGVMSSNKTDHRCTVTTYGCIRAEQPTSADEIEAYFLRQYVLPLVFET